LKRQDGSSCPSSQNFEPALYQSSDFGAQQAASFKKDFAKLVASDADYKFLFVTDSGAFAALHKDKYIKLIPDVRIVHLTTGQEHAA
jgi:hypothetical protein